MRSRWANPRLWIGLCSTGVALLFLLGDFWRTAPGPLTQVHQQAPELSGFRSCSQCHGGFTTSMADSCMSCHQPIQDQLDVGEGLHGRLGLEAAGDCASCHSEHHGANFRIVNRRSFERAGVEDPKAFDHNLIGYEMRGRHLELTCRECHHNAELPVLPPGEHRFLGLSRDCASCHDDPHQGRMVLDCAQCHGEDSFQVLQPKAHDRWLSLQGGHASTDCVDCHQLDTPHALTVWGTRTHRPKRECAACHESPHREAFATQGSPAGTTRCTTCHAIDSDGFAAAATDLTREQHAWTGFALDTPHSGQQCTACHLPRVRGGQREFRERHPGRIADRCEQCHADPHGGQFNLPSDGANLVSQPARCLDCHRRTAFAPHTFDRARHAATSFPLTDRHAETQCEACHEPHSPGAPRRFRATPTACSDCHSDAHAGFFAKRPPSAAPPGSGNTSSKDGETDCSGCHQPTRFSAAADRFEHGPATGFRLGGAHAAGECSECHQQRTTPDEHGRVFGTVAETFGSYSDCGSCHRDPHAGRFDAPTAPSSISGRTSCARCHSDTSFRLLPHGFDHGRWTGFSLDGQHGKIDCAECHRSTDGISTTSRSLPAPAGTTCASCHADPHGGQFAPSATARNSVPDCSRCHTAGVEHFPPDRFDHDRDASFRLGQPHRNLDCSVCHTPYREGERDVLRFRGVPNQCADCHGGADSPFRRRKRSTRGRR